MKRETKSVKKARKSLEALIREIPEAELKTVRGGNGEPIVVA